MPSLEELAQKIAENDMRKANVTPPLKYGLVGFQTDCLAHMKTHSPVKPLGMTESGVVGTNSGWRSRKHGIS